jgi:hypothetical protein
MGVSGWYPGWYGKVHVLFFIYYLRIGIYSIEIHDFNHSIKPIGYETL